MAVPVAIFLLSFSSGILLPASFLPPLAANPAGRIAFWTVCLLLGMAAAVLAMDVYETVRDLGRVSSGQFGTTNGDVFSAHILGTLEPLGPILGLTAAVYMLAPSGRTEPSAERR